MNKTLKISLIAFSAFVAIAALGIWYASSFINPAQLTKILSTTVKESTGRDLQITGPVSLSLFPSISVKAEHVSLSNATWANNPNLVTLKQIELDIRLLPLLKGSVEISRIGLEEVEVHLQTNKDGASNWNLNPPVLPSKPSENQGVAQGALTSAPKNPSTSATDNAFISFKTLDIHNARIHYHDGNQDTKMINLHQVSFGNDGGKSTILVDAHYANYSLNLKGKTSSLRKTYFAWDQDPVKMDLDLTLSLNGKTLAITGEIEKKPQILPTFDIKLFAKSFDLAPLAGSAVVAGSASQSSATVSPKISKKAEGKYFFSDEPIPFDILPLANGFIRMDISELGIPGQAPLTNFKSTFQFQGNKIEASDLSFNVGKGSAQAQLSVSQFDSLSPKVIVKGMAKDFSLEQIIATTDSNAKVSGGATQLAMNLQSSGTSLHQLASRANGAIQISVGPSRLDSGFLNKGGDFLITVFDTINPLYKKSNQTILECAVAYLPISNGVVSIKDSVGAVTDRLNISLAGSVNLNNESLDLNVNPSEKSGLTTGVDLGGLVKIEGTIQNPKAGVNKVGVVNSAVSIGLGFLTGGISIAAENAKSLATKSQPCKTALRSWSEIYPGEK